MKTADIKNVVKNVAILALLVLIVIMGVGWLKDALEPEIYEWTEIFHGYEAYLDRRIFRADMKTASMAPTINIGDTVLWVEIDNKAELEVGDIIIFTHPTRPIEKVCHRITSIETIDGRIMFKTKGDNAPEPDPLVGEELVHGLVIGVIYAV